MTCRAWLSVKTIQTNLLYKRPITSGHIKMPLLVCCRPCTSCCCSTCTSTTKPEKNRSNGVWAINLSKLKERGVKGKVGWLAGPTLLRLCSADQFPQATSSASHCKSSVCDFVSPFRTQHAVVPIKTHAPETGAIKRLYFLAPVFCTGFSYHIRLEWKFLAVKINAAESDVDDEFDKTTSV